MANPPRLEAEITRAFSDGTVPTTEMLTPCDEDEQTIIDAFAQRHWREVDVRQAAIRSSPVLYLLAPEWLHLYLPAFMLDVLQSENDHAGAANLLYVLTPPVRPLFQEEFEKRMALLSPAQRTVVAEFIRHVLARYPDMFRSPASWVRRGANLVAYWFPERETRPNEE